MFVVGTKANYTSRKSGTQNSVLEQDPGKEPIKNTAT